MRKVFTFCSLVLTGMFFVSISSFAQQPATQDGHERAYRRATANPTLTGTIVVRTIDIRDDARFLRVTTPEGVKDYQIQDCDTAHETCQRIINACKAGEQCTIRGLADENALTLKAEFAIAGAGVAAPSANTKTSKKADGTVVTWTRVNPDELKTLGVKDVDACVGKDNIDGAWAEPDYKNEKGALVKGKIWCGAISPKTMNYADAKSYCEDKGMTLASGYTESQNGKNNFPNEDSDWARFLKNSGAKSVKGYEVPKDYTSDVLPNMTYVKDGETRTRYFWSSSAVPHFSFFAYYLNGRTGLIGHDSRYYACSVRCVVARR